VNKAISQEDAMMKVQKDKKGQNDFASSRAIRQEECAWFFPIIRSRPLENDSVPA
jgi:hypothetical protein